MSITSISSASLTSVLSQSVSSLQVQLAQAETELSTGKDADVGLSLGASISQDLSLQQQQSKLQTITTSNGFTATRLSNTQTTLSALQSTAQDFVNSLISDNGTTTASIMQATATANLQTLISGLNTQLNGSYVFAGTNTGNAPISNYFDSSSTSATSVQSAITAQFGSPPDFSLTSASDMSSFLNGQFDDLFSSSSWQANWSSASDDTLTNKISDSQTANTSVSANEDAFRQLTEAYTMVSSFAGQNLSSDAYQAVVTKAQSLVSSAVDQLTDVQASVGVVQSAITSSNTQMSAQMTILQTQVGNLESTDAYDAATRVNDLQTQIETAYSLTSQLKQLSLVNFL